MPLNLIKKYPELLDIGFLNSKLRMESLHRIFNRDIKENEKLNFRLKKIRPTKKEGEESMLTLLSHLTTAADVDDNGKQTKSRSFEMQRSMRLHWIKVHLLEEVNSEVYFFSYEDRIERKDVIRTYIYDKTEKYVIILEPQRSHTDYYLLTAYYLDKPHGEKQINNKLKNKLDELY